MKRAGKRPRTSADREDEIVGTSPAFLAVMERSDESYATQGGISLAEVQRRYGLPARRRKAGRTDLRAKP